MKIISKNMEEYLKNIAQKFVRTDVEQKHFWK